MVYLSRIGNLARFISALNGCAFHVYGCAAVQNPGGSKHIAIPQRIAPRGDNAQESVAGKARKSGIAPAPALLALKDGTTVYDLLQGLGAKQIGGRYSQKDIAHGLDLMARLKKDGQ